MAELHSTPFSMNMDEVTVTSNIVTIVNIVTEHLDSFNAPVFKSAIVLSIKK